MTIERFLGCAESAVLISGKPIRLQNEQPACDKRVTCKYIRLGILYQFCQDKTEIAHTVPPTSTDSFVFIRILRAMYGYTDTMLYYTEELRAL